MESQYQWHDETAQFLLDKGFNNINLVIIAGTGLSEIGSILTNVTMLEYKDIPNFPIATVESHKGSLIVGTVGKYKVLIQQGRFHYYEGYESWQVVYPVRVYKKLNIQNIWITNAAGAINPLFRKQDLMLITDHISLLPFNPLIGKNNEKLGPRFPDMYACYNRDWINIAKETAIKKGINLNEGVYAAVTGPNLETAAEYKYLFTIGADAVGMSTIPEVLVAVHQGMKIMAISVLTDECYPIERLKPTSLEEIVNIANNAQKNLIALFKELLINQKCLD